MDGQTQKTLLIVDDDPRIRSLLCEALAATGYETLQAADGQEALDIVDQHAIDCIISDIKMPELDGITLLYRIKSEKPNIPVLMITGYGYKQLKAEATDAGADGFLMKPFRLGKIEEELSRVLKRSESSEAKRPIHNVMIVEDDDEFRSLLNQIVEAMGYAVTTFTTAETALEAVAKKRPDAIISDFKLPGMTGEDLIQDVKSQYPDLPVILITGYALSINGKEFANGAADAFLLKPFRIDRIGDILRSFEDAPMT